MASVRNVENLTIATQNVIPQLAETPISNIVMLITGGVPAIPSEEFTVSGKTITWDEATAGYNLEVGETVVADYEYDDGTDVVPPFDGTDPQMNPIQVQYNLTVAETGIMPKLTHVPVEGTLTVTVNSSPVTEGVDFTRSGKNMTWISGTTLNINDVIGVAYRKVQ